MFERKKLYRAAMIPFFVNENDEIEMAFIIPSDTRYGGDDPQIAKGKIEPGETEYETAIRESEEELGLKDTNVEWVNYLGLFLGRTHVFICEVKNKEDFDEPHFEVSERLWLTPEEFAHKGRDIHKPVVRIALNSFEEIKNEEDEGYYKDDENDELE